MVKRGIATIGLLFVGGCGIEGLFFGEFEDDHLPPATVINGLMTPALNGIKVQLANGEEVAVQSLDIAAPSATNSAYSVRLPSSDYQNVRVLANEGDLVISTLIPEMQAEGTVDNIALDPVSQTAAILVDASLSKAGKNLQNVEPATLKETFDGAIAAIGQDGPAKELSEMVERLVAAGAKDSTRPAMFQIPEVTADLTVTKSAINPEWLAVAAVDYDGDGTVETGSTAVGKFDRKLREALGSVEVEECIDPVNIRVVFEVDFNAGRLDGNCDIINRFRWVMDAPGKSMFFVGGIHMDSPIQDSAIDAELGNVAGWVPNQITMFDDGTNGDQSAGDNIWTITFSLPRGLRMGYKYTWGTSGALWTGTEEWPGNQQLLEINDVNGDNFVRRHDNFGDEASNKDKSNLNRKGHGVVTWDTDVNGDSIPDVRERPLDPDNDCMPNGFETPTAVGPVTIPCP